MIMSNIFDLFKQIEKDKTPPKPVTHILAGLGNPGAEYARTRHNAGFMAIDRFCSDRGISVTRSRFNALTAEADIGGFRVLIMKPQLYMNRSGESISDAANFYKIHPSNVIVLCDDVNLDVGRIRIRKKGSDGGQKGLRDTISNLGTDEFPRLRIGVGRLPQGGDMVNWVLGHISPELNEDFDNALKNAQEAIPLLIQDKFDEAMCKYN
jgi:PTH1 family peptidyl-tRNA hydrolase